LGAVTESAGPTRELPRSLVSVVPCEGNAGATKKSLLVDSVLDACAARGIAAIGTLNEGALHAQLKDWYRHRGDRVEQLVDGFVVDLVRGELLVEIQTSSFVPLLGQLTRRHRVRLVAPVPLVRTIVRLSDECELLSARRSPRRGRVEDIFSRLVSIPALTSCLVCVTAIGRPPSVPIADHPNLGFPAPTRSASTLGARCARRSAARTSSRCP
jgi:hypothetical protein